VKGQLAELPFESEAVQVPEMVWLQGDEPVAGVHETVSADDEQHESVAVAVKVCEVTGQETVVGAGQTMCGAVVSFTSTQKLHWAVTPDDVTEHTTVVEPRANSPPLA
jgi:hypothetical protein